MITIKEMGKLTMLNNLKNAYMRNAIWVHKYGDGKNVESEV